MCLQDHKSATVNLEETKLPTASVYLFQDRENNIVYKLHISLTCSIFKKGHNEAVHFAFGNISVVDFVFLHVLLNVFIHRHYIMWIVYACAAEGVLG